MSHDEFAVPAPPVTGVSEIDHFLTALNLTDSVTTHPEQLSAALDVLQRMLNQSRADSGL